MSSHHQSSADVPSATKFLLLILVLSLHVQCSGQKEVDKEKLQQKVRDEFLHSWNSYKEYAWGHDELKPLSKSYRDWHSASLLMTPVDALDTMYLMGLTEEADKTRAFIAENLEFDHDIYVKNFEIVIRILGGLLSSYQITGDKRLLVKAEDLGLRLIHVFDSPTGLP